MSVLEIILYSLMGVGVVVWTICTILSYKKKKNKGKQEDEDED